MDDTGSFAASSDPSFADSVTGDASSILSGVTSGISSWFSTNTSVILTKAITPQPTTANGEIIAGAALPNATTPAAISAKNLGSSDMSGKILGLSPVVLIAAAAAYFLFFKK